MPPPPQKDKWRVRITDEELAEGTTYLETIQAAIESFHEFGFVTLENAISHDVLDKFHAVMLDGIKKKIQKGNVRYNHGNETNFSFPPPLEKEYMERSIWANRHALPIMENLIGPNPQLVFASSNNAMPSTQAGRVGLPSRQAVHADPYGITHNFITAVEAFIFTRDCDAFNGSTEIWPGSHSNFRGKEDQVDHGRGWIKREVFSERAKFAPPIQPFVPKGSICLRDIRLWHSGMPNYSNEPRIMLAFIYYPQWFRNHMRIRLPEDCRPPVKGFKGYDLVGATNFVLGPCDNLDDASNVMALNFTQDPSLTLDAQRNAIDLLASRYDPFIEVTPDDYWEPPARRPARAAAPAAARTKRKTNEFLLAWEILGL